MLHAITANRRCFRIRKPKIPYQSPNNVFIYIHESPILWPFHHLSCRHRLESKFRQWSICVTVQELEQDFILKQTVPTEVEKVGMFLQRWYQALVHDWIHPLLSISANTFQIFNKNNFLTKIEVSKLADLDQWSSRT